MDSIRLESTSMGKGIVHWRVVYPHLAKKHRELQREYADLDAACADLKRCLRRDQVDAKTAALVDERAPAGEWGREASKSA
jgi:hypothetical protein